MFDEEDEYKSLMLMKFFPELGDKYLSSKPRANFDLNSYIQDNPHYSDPEFSRGQTKVVFGEQEKGITYDYSDRLWGWDSNKAQSASEYASKKAGRPNTARWHQVFLSQYFDRSVELRCIIVGVNVSSGYSYRCYGYKFND